MAGPAGESARCIPGDLIENRVLPRSGNHDHAWQRRFGCGTKAQGKSRCVSLDVRALGFLLLRLASSYDWLACLVHQLRPAVPHTGAVGGAGMVPRSW